MNSRRVSENSRALARWLAALPRAAVPVHLVGYVGTRAWTLAQLFPEPATMAALVRCVGGPLDAASAALALAVAPRSDATRRVRADPEFARAAALAARALANDLGDDGDGGANDLGDDSDGAADNGDGADDNGDGSDGADDNGGGEARARAIARLIVEDCRRWLFGDAGATAGVLEWAGAVSALVDAYPFDATLFATGARARVPAELLARHVVPARLYAPATRTACDELAWAWACGQLRAARARAPCGALRERAFDGGATRSAYAHALAARYAALVARLDDERAAFGAARHTLAAHFCASEHALAVSALRAQLEALAPRALSASALARALSRVHTSANGTRVFVESSSNFNAQRQGGARSRRAHSAT
jgi:hypothetical protein